MPNGDAAKHVKKSFTARSTVAGGADVCDGCHAAMAEKADILMVDGEERREQKIRCYSWIITRDKCLAATKRNLPTLRSICVNPPSPPFVICLSESGQKHILYLAHVARSRDRFPVQLEEETVWVEPRSLRGALQDAVRISAVIGKKGTASPLRFREQCKILEEGVHEDTIHRWMKLQTTPLGRLAAWLVPGRKDCKNEIHNDGATETKIGGTV
jgi:CRISPR type IV-associated protein Csf1